jgi:origin recognition complex subunit 5
VQAKYDSGIASQLPLFSRLLLISAYICSYTPSRHDESLFLKQSLKKRKRGGGTAKTPSKRQTKNRKISGKLLGPQSFVLERLLAVFQVVRLDAGVGGPGVVSSGADIYMAIATLASLRLVTKGSQGGDPLDGGTKWRVNVGWEVARSMARSVKVELEDFLLD